MIKIGKGGVIEFTDKEKDEDTIEYKEPLTKSFMDAIKRVSSDDIVYASVEDLKIVEEGTGDIIKYYEEVRGLMRKVLEIKTGEKWRG